MGDVDEPSTYQKPDIAYFFILFWYTRVVNFIPQPVMCPVDDRDGGPCG